MAKDVEDKTFEMQEWPDGRELSYPYPGDYEDLEVADGYGGETDGELFGDVAITGNVVHADRVIVNLVNPYTDSLWMGPKASVLRLGRNHFIRTTLVITGSFSGSFEVEHNVCGSKSNPFRFIEVLFQRGSSSATFFHQSGAKPGWTPLDGSGGTPSPTGSGWGSDHAHGDIVETQVRFDDDAEEILISVFRTRSATTTQGYELVIPYASDYAIHDACFAGPGFYVQEGNDPEDYGIEKDSFVVGVLPLAA